MNLRATEDFVVDAGRDLYVGYVSRDPCFVDAVYLIEIPLVGTGIIITPEAGCSRCQFEMSSPIAWRRINSSRPMGSEYSVELNASAAAHMPPMGRGATSSGQMPRSLMRNSAWTGPCVRPMARIDCVARSRIADCCCDGRRDGAT